MRYRRITTRQRAMILSGILLALTAFTTLFDTRSTSFLPSQASAATSPISAESDNASLLSAADRPAKLSDFWNGTAEWVLEIPDTGLPVGESDTIDMGSGIFWSYLHASTPSAGIVDSCGDPVAFPGCVTRWVSTDGGAHFTLAEPTCMLPCDSCPCDEDDKTQQQYPRVVRTSGGMFYMVFEHAAATWFTTSYDGVKWFRPSPVPGTGVWKSSDTTCTQAEHIGSHPFATSEYDCMAGGPPGVYVAFGQIFVFVGLGRNSGHMGCLRSAAGGSYYYFRKCYSNPLFDGAPEYGPLDVLGEAANPYFDFRYVTSADVVKAEGYYYMSYEGIRGPSSPAAGRDNQFALGFARSRRLDTRWEEYPGNPVLSSVVDNWGIGHADLVIVDGTTYMYTATPQMTHGRYVLVYK
ncbi:MAG: hypothetical protein JXB30_05200 [Anaerolineae bacterium]|nr:hypothetical protein [Anaerolineae bacterium]